MTINREIPALIAAILVTSGCVIPGLKTGTQDWEVLTPAAAKAVRASPDSRFTLRLVSALENRDFEAYKKMHSVEANASAELFGLLSDMEPGDFVRLESKFVRGEQVTAEMSAWLVVKDADRLKPDAGAIEAESGASGIPPGTLCEAELALADKMVTYALVMAGGEWKIEQVEGFSEEEESF